MERTKICRTSLTAIRQIPSTQNSEAAANAGGVAYLVRLLRVPEHLPLGWIAPERTFSYKVSKNPMLHDSAALGLFRFRTS